MGKPIQVAVLKVKMTKGLQILEYTNENCLQTPSHPIRKAVRKEVPTTTGQGGEKAEPLHTAAGNVN